MVFEIGECILPVIVIRRSHRLIVKIDDPIVLFGINRAFPRQGQPHEAHARPNTFASREERLAEQNFRLEVSFTGGEKQPPDCLPTVLGECKTNRQSVIIPIIREVHDILRALGPGH
jgi:hypothetical protein